MTFHRHHLDVVAHPTLLTWIAALLFFVCPLLPTGAQTIWSGYDFSFSRLNFVDPALPSSQDRITSSVWISRNTNQGIYNAKTETFYVAISPADTEWATDINNVGKTIAASNWSNLAFDSWIDSYGGQGTQQLPSTLIGRNAVVHLITDDIYLDLRFTAFSQGGGGGFAYVRAVEPTQPVTTGDYNNNGIVDAADYVVWRRTLDQSVSNGTGADGVPDGIIDGDDYNFWVTHYGEVVPLGSSVPEPAMLVMLLTMAIVSNGSSRRLHYGARSRQTRVECA